MVWFVTLSMSASLLKRMRWRLTPHLGPQYEKSRKFQAYRREQFSATLINTGGT
jgi:hypothetical protein